MREDVFRLGVGKQRNSYQRGKMKKLEMLGDNRLY